MTEQLPLNTSPLPVKLRVEDYLLLDQAGAFDAYAKTELIEGEILFMNAQHRPHARFKGQLYRRLAEALERLDNGLEALVEASIDIPPFNTPEPDIVLTYLSEGEGLVPLGSVALVVEVSDSTLGQDLGNKAMLYARHGIPEYWVADLSGRVIHQMWAPGEEAYAQHSRIDFGKPIVAASIEGLAIATTGL